MKPIRVLIIDEHPAVRRALKTRLESVAEIEVVGTVEDIVEGELAAHQMQPDVILLGLKSYAHNAAATLSQAVTQLHEAGSAVLILSPYPDDVEQEIFYQVGASGYLLKDINSPQLISAIQQVINTNEVNING